MIETTKRNLPHWTEIDSIYFITFKLKQGILIPEEQQLVKDHIIQGQPEFYLLHATIVMPDHVHLILKPQGTYALRRIMKGIKGVSAHKVNLLRGTKGTLWQDESFDRIIRDLDEFEEKLLYMYNNPIKAELTDDTDNYVGWYLNEELLQY
jgi:REP element-mobilizing transposase RayT